MRLLRRRSVANRTQVTGYAASPTRRLFELQEEADRREEAAEERRRLLRDVTQAGYDDMEQELAHRDLRHIFRIWSSKGSCPEWWHFDYETALQHLERLARQYRDREWKIKKVYMHASIAPMTPAQTHEHVF